MKDWFRWSGIAAFAAVVALIAAVWLLLVDVLVEKAVEGAGTKMVGAKVELASADVTLTPLGVELDGLQVTNPGEPMTNAVEIGRIKFGVETLNLLRRKLIIDEMAVDNIRFGTPRKSSGAIKGREEKKPEEGKAEKFAMPSFELPDVKKVLEGEELQTLVLANSLKTDVENMRTEWTAQLKELPDRQKIDDYKARVEKLKSEGKGGVLGVLKGAGELKELQADIAADLNRVKDAQKGFERQTAELKGRLKDLSAAPAADVTRLADKYGLSSEGLSNLGRLVLGAKLDNTVRKALYWYGKAAPFIERAGRKKDGEEVVKPLRGKGVDVRFREDEPLPDFLVRKASVSLNLDAGSFGGDAANITPDQDILGKPMTFELSGVRLDRIAAIELKGKINHVRPAEPVDQASLVLRGYMVDSMPLSDSPELAVTLQSALADATVAATISGGYIDADISASLGAVTLKADAGDEPSAVTRAMASALSGIRQAGIRARITGTPQDYNIAISSDLDRVLKDAVGGLIKEQTAELKEMLTREINARVKGPVTDVTGDYTQVDRLIGGELDNRINMLNGLI